MKQLYFRAISRGHEVCQGFYDRSEMNHGMHRGTDARQTAANVLKVAPDRVLVLASRDQQGFRDVNQHKISCRDELIEARRRGPCLTLQACVVFPVISRLHRTKVLFYCGLDRDL